MVNNYAIERQKKLELKPINEEETPQKKNNRLCLLSLHERIDQCWSWEFRCLPAMSLDNYVRSYDPDRISDDKIRHYDFEASGSIHLYSLADVDPSCLYLRRWKITVLTVEPNRRLD